LRNQLLQARSPVLLSSYGIFTVTVIGHGPKPQRHLDEGVLKTRLGAKERDKQIVSGQKKLRQFFGLLCFVSSLDVCFFS
jgi:hypothetical protein